MIYINKIKIDSICTKSKKAINNNRLSKDFGIYWLNVVYFHKLFYIQKLQWKLRLFW